MKKILFFTLALLLCFTAFTSYSLAANDYPSIDTIPDLTAENIDAYYIYKSSANGDQYFCKVFRDVDGYIESNGAEFKVTKFSNNDPLVQLVDSNGNTYSFKTSTYRYVPNNSLYPTLAWVVYNAGNVYETYNSISSSMIDSSSFTFYESTFDIPRKDGTIFFPKPPEDLYLVIQGVTMEEMTMFPTKVVGMMKILVLCGVGCLALLMVLNLFGKILGRYRH